MNKTSVIAVAFLAVVGILGYLALPHSTIAQADAPNTQRGVRPQSANNAVPSPVTKTGLLDRKRSAPVPATDIVGRPIDLNGLPVGQYVSTLEAAAKGGDPAAQFNIYRALTICARLADQQNILNALPPGTTDKGLLSSLQSGIDSGKAVCTDVTELQITRDRLDYLDRAAKSGLATAQIAFYAEGPNGHSHDFSQKDDDPNIAQWKTQATTYLTQAASQGNQLALGMLSKAYEDGQVVEQNLQLSLTYAIADAKVRNLDPGSQTVVNSLSKKLSSAQVSAAIAAASELVHRCCSKQ